MLRTFLKHWFGGATVPAPPLAGGPAEADEPPVENAPADGGAADFAAGVAAFRAGAHGEAVAHFRAALAAQPADPVRLYHLASALAAHGELAAAAPPAAQAFAADPRNPDFAACLRFITIHLGIDDAAGADPFWGALARGNRLLAAGDAGGGLEFFRQAQALEPGSAAIADRIGTALCHLGRFEEAAGHLRAAAALGWPLDGMMDLRATHLQSCAAAADWRGYAAGLAPGRHGGTARLTVLVGCDGHYFRTFVPALVNSLARNAGIAAQVHVHLLDADAACDAVRAQLLARHDIAVEISVGPQALPCADRRLAYACARFFVAPALLERDALPVLILDADLLALRPLGALLERIAGADYAIPPGGPPNTGPPEMLWASLVWFAPTAAGRTAAGLAANYILRAMQAGTAEWFIDQIALLAAHAWGRGQAGLQFCLLPATLLQNGDAPLLADAAADPLHACFWSLANSVPQHQSRVEHPLYQAYARS